MRLAQVPGKIGRAECGIGCVAREAYIQTPRPSTHIVTTSP